MARIVVIVLLASLALAPAAEATAPGRGESPSTGWLDALRSVFDLFSRAPSFRAVPRKNGANIVPNGFAGPPPGSGRGVRSVARNSGAHIIPNGIGGPPPATRARGVRSLSRNSGEVIIPNGIAGPRPALGRGRVTVPGGVRSPGR